MNGFSHLGPDGQPRMVDISAKEATVRTAHARAELRIGPALVSAFRDGDLLTPKGSATQTAIIAGIQAAKRTGDLIPLCHPLPLDRCEVSVTPELDRGVLVVDCHVRATWKTGVEMEALTGVSVAALTLYDMGKSVSHEMEIVSIRLMEKTGGKHGAFTPDRP